MGQGIARNAQRACGRVDVVEFCATVHKRVLSSPSASCPLQTNEVFKRPVHKKQTLCTNSDGVVIIDAGPGGLVLLGGH